MKLAKKLLITALILALLVSGVTVRTPKLFSGIILAANDPSPVPYPDEDDKIKYPFSVSATQVI